MNFAFFVGGDSALLADGALLPDGAADAGQAEDDDAEPEADAAEPDEDDVWTPWMSCSLDVLSSMFCENRLRLRLL